MKIESLEIVDLGAYFSRRPNKRAEAAFFVDPFFNRFKDLAGTQKGIVVSIEEPGDVAWPTIEKYKVMDDNERKYIGVRTRNRMIYVLKELRSRIKYKYIPKATYIGSGKVILWWKFLPKRRTNGAVGSE